MQAVILAGGFGKRLAPLTFLVPKPMAPVLGRPYLEYQIDWLKLYGITDILILTGYLGEAIEGYFKDGSEFGVKVSYSREKSPLGTAGGLKLAEDKLEPYFALIYGDSFLPVDYTALEKFFLVCGLTGAVVVYGNHPYDAGVNGNTRLTAEGLIEEYRKDSEDKRFSFTEAGVMVLKKDVTDLIMKNVNLSLENDIFPDLIVKKELCAYISKVPFYDIGTPERIKRFEEALKSGNLNLKN